MPGEFTERYAETLVSRSRVVIVLVLVLTAAVAAGAAFGETEDEGIGDFDTESEETDALEYIDEAYATDDGVVTQIVIRDEGGDVLTRESLLTGLEVQEQARETESVNETLGEGFVGLENLVATGLVFQDRAEDANGPPETAHPTLEEQIAALEDRSDEDVEEFLETILDPDEDFDGEDPYDFLPADYEPGSTDAESRIVFLFQEDDSGQDDEPQVAYDAQLEVESIVDASFDDAFVFGQGISDAASASAVGDSFAIITPVALVLVLFVLGATYRDFFDVLVAFTGIAVVMAWLAGIMGWLEIPMNQLLIAVPFLLIGLSIDYSIHVVMRYREARNGTLEGRYGEVPVRTGIVVGMTLGLASVILALAAATVSTGVGFLSNVVSPLPAIRDFAILSASGILATFVAFGVFVPAVKVELDGLLENRFDRNRAKEPFGMGAGIVNTALLGVVGLVRTAPLGVIILAVLLAVGGAYGATGIDTEFNEADFLPQDAPEWTQSLPGPLAPDTYTIADDAEYLGDNFGEQGERAQAQVLIRGNVTDPATLAALDDAATSVDENGSIDVRADGTISAESPLTVLEEVAEDDDELAAEMAERDVLDGGASSEDLTAVYDTLFEVDPDSAERVLERTENGEYESARVVLTVRGDASAQTVAEDVRTYAENLESNASVTAVATGGPVTNAVVQDALLETLVQAFAVTLVVILGFLTALYWVRHRALSLGAITLAPVVAALAWLLGGMALFDVPFNSETAVITSLAIGLGVDYSIHVGERFVEERERRETLDGALVATVTGTGGALLGSAATTAAGFGVLALALAPPLQRFGIVTGMSIILAFIACLTVLPCLLVVRERLLERFEWGDYSTYR